MGCKELKITDYYRFLEPDEKSYSRAGEITCTAEKNRYKPVFHTVISNYRYYSPELGRWLTRDPIYEVGSIIRLEIDSVRQQQQLLLELIRNRIEYIKNFNNILKGTVILQDKVRTALNSLKNAELFLEGEITYNISGHPININLYNFASNEPVNKTDYLGLVAGEIEVPTAYVLCFVGIGVVTYCVVTNTEFQQAMDEIGRELDRTIRDIGDDIKDVVKRSPRPTQRPKPKVGEGDKVKPSKPDKGRRCPKTPPEQEPREIRWPEKKFPRIGPEGQASDPY